MKKFTFIDETGNEDEEAFNAKKKRVRDASRLNLAVSRNYRIVPVNKPLETGRLGQVHDVEIDNSRVEQAVVTESSWRIAASVPHQGYSSAVAKYRFNLLDLSALCSMHMGLPAATVLHGTEGKLAKLLRERQACYLDFVPARYDQSHLIRTAVDCVLARARSLICGDGGLKEATILGLFGRALRELQAALNDWQRVCDADVLCASLLMQLYEVLDLSSPDRWRSHAGGVIKLVRLRGPDRYGTAFERALLMTQLRTAYTESLDFSGPPPKIWNSQNSSTTTTFSPNPNQNVMGLRGTYHAIFLAQPEWQAVLEAIPELPDSEQHPIATTLWASHSGVQSLVRVVSDYVMGSVYNFEYQEYLNVELRMLDQGMQRWQDSCNSLLSAPEGHNKAWKPRELLGFSYAARFVLARLIVAMDPLGMGRQYERLAQDLASSINQLSRDAKQEQPHRGDLFLQRPLMLRNLAWRTAELWEAAVEGAPGHIDAARGVVSQFVFSNISVSSGRPPN